MRAVLTYHSIDESGSPISVSADQFSAHMRFLASGAVQVVSLSQLISEEEYNGLRLAITFDDGFKNFESVALPRLVDSGLPSTLFVVTGAVGGNNAWGNVETPGIPTLPLLDWDGLGRVREAGVELGAHTRTHPHLPECSSQALADELDHPIAELQQRLKVKPVALAYPYGDHDAATVTAARARYDFAVTTRLAIVEPRMSPLAIPRLDMFYLRDPGRLENIGTSGFHAYLTVRRTLRSIRSAVLRT